jgi:transposase-like protein
MNNTPTLLLAKKKIDLNINHVVTELDKLNNDEYQIIIDHLSQLRKERRTKKEKNSEKKVDKPTVCPHCGETEFTLAGKQSGKQRFRCTSCGKKIFNEKKSFSVWYNSKYSSDVWKQFITYELQHLSLRESSSLLGISLSTLFVWRHKVLTSLDKYYESSNRFRGYVQIDEVFFPFSTKGNKNACRNLKKGYDSFYESDYKNLRASKKLHKRGKDSSTRGLSREKVCCPTALTMLHASATSRVTNFGKPSSNDIEYAFKDKISGDVVLLSDGEKSTNYFAMENEIPIIQIKRGMKHSEIQNVNSLHSKMKTNFKRYRSVNTKHLDNYQVLAIFEQLHKNTSASEKAEILFQILKDVKDPLTYEGLSNKRYPEFVYEYILDENTKKAGSPNSTKENCSNYDYLPF